MDMLRNVARFVFTASDPRFQDWILFKPYAVIFILFSYLYFVLVCGPRFMKNRKPYSLKTFIKFYNIFQIFLNGYMVYKFLRGCWYLKISIYCHPVSYDTSPEDMEIAVTSWLCLVSKIIDLIETVIFILRKKDKQVSFLHLYHHVTTLTVGWIFGKHYSGGMAVIIPIVNCSVHVIMYTYYFASLLDGKIRDIVSKYKHWVTIIQMVQFVLLLVHNGQAFSPNCDVPNVIVFISCANYVINFFLFYNFYKHAYLKKNIKYSQL
ncbi:PREDICTED: elongation of very long chain fatty acids protein 1-like [Polistes dominula]|uniref:Elongation of very long chain fatty acids protein n=1 Tax=Polistes dominula TaxID=743375 RepID=A0ABM1IBD2_POLDO|nr:PREDICTED: elongation of very long chain fatty acids protein 1-like [Polistes dominula]